MTVKNLVGTLARTGVSTAVSVVRHPIGSASLAAGMVKGVAEVGVHVVRSAIVGQPPAPEREISDPVQDAVRPATDPAPDPAPDPVVDDPRDHIPGPDLAAFQPPTPADLPEPIVIEAEPEAPGEAFHTEPKAASRDSAHGGPAGDREEIEGYVEEIDLDDLEPDLDLGPKRG